MEIPVRTLVVGDIVKISEGGRMPADCRILDAKTFFVDISSINGESAPFHVTSTTSPADTDVVESNCLAFNGSPICQGHAVRFI